VREATSCRKVRCCVDGGTLCFSILAVVRSGGEAEVYAQACARRGFFGGGPVACWGVGAKGGHVKEGM
jgi:hypothetical protein